MKMKNKEKDFDAVKMMREIRDKLSEKFEPLIFLFSIFDIRSCQRNSSPKKS